MIANVNKMKKSSAAKLLEEGKARRAFILVEDKDLPEEILYKKALDMAVEEGFITSEQRKEAIEKFYPTSQSHGISLIDSEDLKDIKDEVVMRFEGEGAVYYYSDGESALEDLHEIAKRQVADEDEESLEIALEKLDDIAYIALREDYEAEQEKLEELVS